MKIMVFDDDNKRRNHMISVIQETKPEAELISFQKINIALEYAKNNLPEVAFVSVDNDDGKGYFFIKKLVKLSSRTNVIAISYENRFIEELMKLRISGYVTEDLTKENVTEEILNLRYQ